MIDTGASTIPQTVHDAAEGWMLRRQQGLDAQSETEFQSWLARATIHRIAYAQADELWHDSGRLRREGLGINRQLRRAPLFMRHRPRVVAGAVGVVAALGLVSTSMLSRFSSWSIVPAAAAELVSSKLGEIRRIRLRDGTILILDTSSNATVRFDHGAPRISLLSGRLRIKTNANDGRSLILAAAHRELSTEDAVFDVDLRGSTPYFQVYKGGVSVTPPIGGSTSLRAGQIASDRTGRGNQARDPVAPRSDWTSGMLSCDATPLSSAVTAINRYNTLQIVLVDRSLSTIRISGAFRVTDPTGFANAVARLYHLTVQRNGSRKIELSVTRSKISGG